MPKNNGYVWFNEKDTTRNPYAAFRRTFELDKLPEKAELNLFADTVYKIYVNGTFAGFGPVRFDPRFPQYDTYDLKPFLKRGKNAIAILVNFHGHKVFKSIPCVAALKAWGTITLHGADDAIDLCTSSGWKCKRHAAYDRYTPKLSFALFAQTHFDQKRFDDAWINADFNDGDWPDAVPLADQNAFGELEPREIPFMSLENIALTEKVRVFPLAESEDIYSFMLPIPDNFFYENDPNYKTDYLSRMTWASYIYSSVAQTVNIGGTIYESVYINGKPAEGRFEDEGRPMRYNFHASLNAGWNYIFNEGGVSDIATGYIGLPKHKGLILSADKNPASGFLFKHTPILPLESKNAFEAMQMPWPENIDIFSLTGLEPEESWKKTVRGGWVYSTKKQKGECPCREASWAVYDPSVETVAPENINGFVFQKRKYPHGFALLFDMGHMKLSFPCLRLSGVKGATVDFLYNDRLTADGKHVRQQFWIPLGDRLVCSEETINFSAIQPRGFKVMSITVTNATEDVTLERIDFRSAHYPVKHIGKFECSDPKLNAIWEICARSQETNMEDAYVDCVDRERGLYTLDVLDQYHTNLACFGDHLLLKRGLELYAQSAYNGMFRAVYPNTGTYTLPDFALYAVDAFYSWYRQTGDKAFIERWWDDIKKNLDVFTRLSDSHPDLLMNGDPPDRNNPEDVRTWHLGDGGCTVSKGINCIYSCLYLIALRGAEFLASQIGRLEESAEFKRRITILEAAIPNTFWNEKLGCFSDNSEMKYFSPHASLFAVRAGVVAENLLPALKKHVAEKLTPFYKNGVNPKDGVGFTLSYAYYMFDSLYKAGLYEVAENCMNEGWGWFLTQGLKTTPEHFDLEASQCHAWASGPAYVMSKHILGIDFNFIDGLEKVNVHVKTSDRIKWAKGIFPHPWGDIKIEWHKENGKYVFDMLEAPKGVVCTLTH